MSGDVNLEVVAETEIVELDPATEIERLAALDPISYEAERKKMPDALGIRASVLDELVKAKRQENGIDGDGDNLGLFEPEPWTHTVDGAALLNGIVCDLCRYMVMPRQAAEVVALWTVHTHVFDYFQHTPRLHVTAPEKGCGKSTLLDVLAFLVPKAIKTENLSTAVLFRAVDKYQPTLLIDEVDTFLRDNEELRGCLNAGHAKGGKHLRCVGDNHDLKAFRTFAPAALAGIGKISPILADRSIQIILQKRRSDEPVENFRADRAQHLRDRASQIARWVHDHEIELRAAEPELPGGVLNRLADNWRPLVAIADIAGGDWPDRARKALGAMSHRDDDEGESIRVQLLADIRMTFEATGNNRITSEALVTWLHDMEDRPWPDYGRAHKPITKTQVARLLKSFGIAPNTIRDGDKPLKGYKRGQFADAFSRYLPNPSVTSLQPAENRENPAKPKRYTGSVVTVRETPKAAESLACNGVTDENPGNDDSAYVLAESDSGEAQLADEWAGEL